MSADGRRIAFGSSATDLPGLDPEADEHADRVFVRDMGADGVDPSTTLVSGRGIASSGNISMIADGNAVGFFSQELNLGGVPTYTDQFGNHPYRDNVYVYYLSGPLAGTHLVSVNADGTASGDNKSGGPGPGSNDWIKAPELSADGRYVAFWSLAHDLVESFVDGNDREHPREEHADLFVRDVQTGATRLITVNASGTASASDINRNRVGYSDGADQTWDSVRFSDDGTVFFDSPAGDLIAGDRNYVRDVFVDTQASELLPTASHRTLSVLEDETHALSAADFGINGTSDVKFVSIPPVGSLKLGAAAVTPGQTVSAADIAAARLTFTPEGNKSGAAYAKFCFQTFDATAPILDPTINSMTIKVASVNDSPSGIDSWADWALEDMPQTLTISDFRLTADGVDFPENLLAGVVVTTLPEEGTLVLGGDPVTAGQWVAAADIAAGLLQFTPAANAQGGLYTTFTFQVEDDGETLDGGENLDPTANTLSINVTPVELGLWIDEPQPLAEGTKGQTTLSFRVGLTKAADHPVTVTYATARDTAVPGKDFKGATGRLTFLPGRPLVQTVRVSILNDRLYENAETFKVNLSNAKGAPLAVATATGTILDNDPMPRLSIADVSVVEGKPGAATKATFTVALSAASGATTTVAWATADGTAPLADADYLPGGGVLTFRPGATKQRITVLVNGDANVELHETYLVQLFNPAGATLSRSEAKGTIRNDDRALTRGDINLAGIAPLVHPRELPPSLLDVLAGYQRGSRKSRKSTATSIVDEAIGELIL